MLFSVQKQNSKKNKKTKTKQKKKKGETRKFSYFVLLVFSKSSFYGFCQPLFVSFLFWESFNVIKMAAELDFGCVHSPTGTEQEGSKVRGREVMRQEG